MIPRNPEGLQVLDDPSVEGPFGFQRPACEDVQAHVRVQLRVFSIRRTLEAVWLVDDQTDTPVVGWNLERLAQGTVDRLDDVRPGSITERTVNLDQDARHQSQSSSS